MSNLCELKILKEKLCSLFAKDALEFKANYQRAILLNQNKQIPIEFIWEGFFKKVTSVTQNLIVFIKNLPGFEDIEQNKLREIVQRRIFAIFGLKVTKCISQGESYLIVLDGRIQLSKHYMNILFGPYLTELILNFHSKLNSLCLTDMELALIAPFILALPGWFIF